MSIEIVKSQIRRFLSSDEPEVICISGRWGVGKTYAWNQYVKDAHDGANIALKRYSYVSLFGVNSLDELKYAIFENSVKSSDVGVELTLKTLRSNTTAAAVCPKVLEGDQGHATRWRLPRWAGAGVVLVSKRDSRVH